MEVKMELVDIEEIADIMDISVPTVRNYIKKGLPYVREGIRYFFCPEVCKAWPVPLVDRRGRKKKAQVLKEIQ
jgi:hypothetical protein